MPGHGRADFALRMFRHMAQALDLSDDQKTKIKDVLKTYAAEVEAQMKASGSARRALHQAILAEPIDEAAIRSAAAALGSVEGNGAVLFAKIRSQVDPILTDEQRA